MLNAQSLRSFSTFRTYLLSFFFGFVILITVNSCKREIFSPAVNQTPKTNGKLQVISYAEFLTSINPNALGLLKSKLTGANPANKLLSIADNNSFGILSIYADSVQKLTNSGGTSYVFKMALSSKRAVGFRNLTVFVNSEGKTSAFIATYIPTQEWIAAWKTGKKIEFKGEVSFTPIRLESANLTQALSVNQNGNATGGKVMGIGNKTMVVSNICYSYTVWQPIPMLCSSGKHRPGDDCEYYTNPGGYPPYYDYGYVDHTDCFDVDLDAEQGTSNSGTPTQGGGSTPTPPGDYHPCNDEPTSSSAIKHEGGLKLAVVPPSACDVGGDGGGGDGGLYPLPPTSLTSAQFLINVLQITDQNQQNFITNSFGLAKAFAEYIKRNNGSAYSIEFAKWLFGYLYANPSIDYHDFLDQNDFDDMNNPPLTSPNQDLLINNGIELGDVPNSITTNAPKVIGKTDDRHNTEDMEYGTNGDPSGILPGLIPANDAVLFVEMRTLFSRLTANSNLAIISSQMINRFQANTGGTYESTLLNQEVKESSTFKNFMRLFGDRLNLKLRTASGAINNVQTIDLTFRPKFNGLYNKFAGFQILINDTEYTEIRLLNFNINQGLEWYADVEVVIEDHFGLDRHDAMTYQGYHSGFAAWYLLQHTRNYKPFKTKITVKTRIYGQL